MALLGLFLLVDLLVLFCGFRLLLSLSLASTVFFGLSEDKITSITLMLLLSFFFGFIVSKKFMQATNSDETFAKPISCMRLLILVLLVVPLICLSEDAIEKFRGESMVLIGIGLPKAVVSVARRALVDFLVGSAVVAGYGGVVFCPVFWKKVLCSPSLWKTIRRMTEGLFPCPFCQQF